MGFIHLQGEEGVNVHVHEPSKMSGSGTESECVRLLLQACAEATYDFGS